jgi:hypothetical protein
MCIDDQPIQVGNAHFAWHYPKKTVPEGMLRLAWVDGQGDLAAGLGRRPRHLGVMEPPTRGEVNQGRFAQRFRVAGRSVPA